MNSVGICLLVQVVCFVAALFSIIRLKEINFDVMQVRAVRKNSTMKIIKNNARRYFTYILVLFISVLGIVYWVIAPTFQSLWPD